jgi:sugar/nucleoside kinase (ribokinase family)
VTGILNLPAGARLRYEALLGTGGIGSGSFFMLNGNHTLGREESRSGRFLDRRDYCKLHIVCHYVQALLGPGFPVLPIGRLGDDDAGRALRREMEEVGLDLRHVCDLPGRSTLYSFCFLYPDGTGGNLTADDSASAAVDATCIESAAADFAAWRGRGIALAVPEVPLAARRRLLELGGEHSFLRAASFTLGEMPALRAEGLLAMVDLLALNLEEALAATGLEAEGRHAGRPGELAARAAQELAGRHPALLISITAGAAGNWSWDGRTLAYVPAIRVPVQTTSGAGDAHFAGILAGLAVGLPLEEAQCLGTLVASASVTSPHTIHKGITRAQLRELAGGLAVRPGPALAALLAR